MSAVPDIQWTPQGIVVPAEADLLTGVQNLIDQIFGGNLSYNGDTPQGQLATSFTKILQDKNSQIAEIVNQVNPDFASGRWQDAIGRIYFLERIAGQGTVLTLTCNGLPGTSISSGDLVKDGNGNLYACSSPATIGTSGNVNTQFTCTVTGPTAVPSQVSIYQAVSGWDSVTVVSGVVGRDVETRAEFEARRRASVARNSKGYVASVQAAVLEVSGVLSCYVVCNFGSTSQTVGGVTLSPHSLYVAVSGGTDQDVANAIWMNKSMGCDYNGNTTVTVYDSSIGTDPLPAYDVQFERPADLPIYFSVTIKADSSLPTDIDTQIQTAIENALSGADGKQAAQIGSTIYASRFYAGVAATGAEVIQIQIGLSSGAETANTQAVNIDQIPTFGALTVTQQ